MDEPPDPTHLEAQRPLLVQLHEPLVHRQRGAAGGQTEDEVRPVRLGVERVDALGDVVADLVGVSGCPPVNLCATRRATRQDMT